MKVVPRPSSLSTATSPPDCLAKPNTWLRPRPVPLPISLVVKNGSNTRASRSGAMPEPVSVSETAAKGPAAAAWPRIGGSGAPHCRRSVSVPAPSIASRAFTAMLTRAVSNWLASTRTKHGWSGTSVTTLIRAPVTVSSRSPTRCRRAPTSSVSGFSVCRRAKARSWPVSLAARSTVSETALR